MKELIDLAGQSPCLRVAVADVAQKVVLETAREAVELGITEPRLIGDVTEILALCLETHWAVKPDWQVEAAPDGAAAIHAVRMGRDGAADIVKG